jgi:hypothetical protein
MAKIDLRNLIYKSLSFPTQSTKRATKLLELVHFDLCGPMQSLLLGLTKHFVSFIDDFARFTMVYL